MGGAVSRPGRRRSGHCLLEATRNNNIDVFNEILSANPAAAAYCTIEGISCLHVAAAACRADLLERLLAALARAGAARRPKVARRSVSKAVNQKNVLGQTPLMLACKAGSAECVRLLLGAGADATLFDEGGARTCLHYAALYGREEAIDALLGDDSAAATPTTAAEQQQQQQPPPHQQPQQAQPQQGEPPARRQPLRECLLADSQGHHRYVDGRAGFGLAPLHLAAHQGHLAAVRALLHWGASLTVRCNVAFSLGAADPWTPASTPLHFAAARGRGRVVLVLLQAAAERAAQGRQPVDPRLLQDYRGQRPYDLALAHGHRQLLWALHPRLPLSALRQPPAPEPAVPSLVALASGALRQHLQHQLVALKEAVAAAAAEAPPRPRPGSRRGSRAPSREGSGHGGGAYAALLAARASALLGRMSGGHASSAATVQPSGSVGGGGAAPRPARHARHVSDSGVGGALHGFQPTSAALLASGSVGGGLSCSRRAAASHATLCPVAQQAQQREGLPEAAAAGSVAGCRTATSVTSVAGCPVCLDCGLEVAVSPCRHGLCLECAQHLSSPEDAGCCAGGAAPPLCPLCRGVMAGFTLL